MQHDNGIMHGTGYNKQGLRLNLTQAAGSKLKIQVNANILHTLTQRGISNNAIGSVRIGSVNGIDAACAIAIP